MAVDQTGYRLRVVAEDGIIRLWLGSLVLDLQIAEAETLGWHLLDAIPHQCGHCQQTGPSWHDQFGARRCRHCDWRVDLQPVTGEDHRA